jgi:hypothetical protein
MSFAFLPGEMGFLPTGLLAAGVGFRLILLLADVLIFRFCPYAILPETRKKMISG